jgi:hypothetical protein
MREVWLAMLVALAVAALVGGCRRGSSNSPGQVTQPALSGLPTEMRVRQRSTEEVAGSDGQLRLTAGDVTRNQVLVSLAAEGEVALAPMSMSPGDSETFTFGGKTYLLTLKGLTNALTGEDFATFVISDPSAGGLTEPEKILLLIEAIAGMEDAVFIRNGVEHSSVEAAEHLKMKWQARSGDITSAEQFIEVIASRSSVSGEAYVIRQPDGTSVPSGEYLREKLGEIGG